MYKVATRYLSGVTVFLGDDITQREVTGEVAVIIGQAKKGPSSPVELKSIDNAIALYGVGSPILKGLYEFNDGYKDSPKAQNIKYVTMRLGGVKLEFTTKYGLSMESVDAYDNLEDDYYIYVNDLSSSTARVKIWNIEKALVYDSSTGIDAGYFTVTSLPTGTSAVEYGVDIDEYPLATPATIRDLVIFDLKAADSGINVPTSTTTNGFSWSIVDDPDFNLQELIPDKGTIKLTKLVNGVEQYLTFSYGTTYDELTGSTLFSYDTIPNLSTLWAWATCTSISIIGANSVTYSSSELTIDNREVYEKLRLALLDVELYTPDYIIPAGIPYNANYLHSQAYTKKTVLKQSVAKWNDTSLIVEDTTDWPEAGEIFLTNTAGIESGIHYTSISASGSYKKLTLDIPIVTVAKNSWTRISTTEVKFDLGSNYNQYIGSFSNKGYCVVSWVYSNAPTVDCSGLLRYRTVVEKGITKIVATLKASVFDNPTKGGTVQTKSIRPALSLANVYTTANTVIETATFYKDEYFDLGLGWVKETDNGDHIIFDWSNVKKNGYYLAHFGYLVGKFCNDATLGYNTPLFGMNVEVPFSSTPTRSQLVSWIGTLPNYITYYGEGTDSVTAITENGTGLLGDMTLAGGVSYNRCIYTDSANGIFADPAYGLLLTDEGFIDGTPLKDDYNKLVDLGKYGIVGAGILTFSNSSSTSSYLDAMGIYTLGVIAGLPKNEGASFRKIGTSSGVTVSAIVPRNYYNDLARLGYIVTTREKGLGWVINNDTSVARDNSGYYLLSTTRTIKYVIEDKRAILAGFIGKPVTTYNYEAAKTKLSESFSSDVTNGMLNGFKFSLEAVETARVMGKLLLNCSVNPVLELVQVDINAVIDRNVTSTTTASATA